MTAEWFKKVKIGDTVEDVDSGIRFIVREKYNESKDICVCDENGWTTVMNCRKLWLVR